MSIVQTPGFYYTIRTILLVISAILFVVIIIYGKKVNILSILGKRTGITQKREIAKIKAGKALGRRKVSGQEETSMISMQQMESEEGTQKLDGETALMNSSFNQSMEETTLLSKEDKEVPEFRIITNIVVVNGDPI